MKILSQAKVNEVYAPIKSDHGIFVFDVMMNKVLGMNAFQCVELEKSVNILRFELTIWSANDITIWMSIGAPLTNPSRETSWQSITITLNGPSIVYQ